MLARFKYADTALQLVGVALLIASVAAAPFWFACFVLAQVALVSGAVAELRSKRD